MVSFLSKSFYEFLLESAKIQTTSKERRFKKYLINIVSVLITDQKAILLQ